VNAGDLTDVTDINDVPEASEAESASFKGWKINLDLSGNYTYLEGSSSVTRSYKAERVITDSLATTSGIVFYTSFKPYSDECAIGGKTFLWAVKYDTGGAGGALLKGIALIQVSTAAIEQINLSSAFSQKGGRCTSAMEGVPPTAQGLSLITMPPPVKRVIHVKER
jgi:type IV pilus assembly protein PilY1